jgi:hypothetical protein
MPEDLRGRLADAAARSGRSLNAELVDRLERSLRPSPFRMFAGAAALVRDNDRKRGEMLRRRYRVALAVAGVVVLALAALVLSVTGLTGSSAARGDMVAAQTKVDPDKTASPGLGPNSADAYLQAERTYPANVIPTSVQQNALTTFERIANQRDRAGEAGNWEHYGPKVNAIEPGILSFTGPTTPTASRITALAITPDGKRLYAGAAGGGVWMTDNPNAPDPEWHQITNGLAQNSVGTITIDPTDPSGRTIYLGTGEANRCTSGCEAGVGIYKSTNGGHSWTKLTDTCVDNPVNPCTTPGQDSFLGRAISNIVIDPTNSNHIFVGSANAVRGLTHTIGNGGQTQLEPGANAPGLYESTDGGATFTRVWNARNPAAPTTAVTRGINDVALDPLNPTTVYASAMDAGLWRRSPSLDGSTTPFSFVNVYSPHYVPPACTATPSNLCGFFGVDRTMFAPTVKNGTTRIYLAEGTQNLGPSNDPMAATFWRTDDANQPAATLLAYENGPGATEPPATTVGPQTYPGWQKLTSGSTASPYYATTDVCTGQCWYDLDVITPKGMPDTVYEIGSYSYGELPCNLRGVGCAPGRSDGRAVLYSTSAGDPEPVTPAFGAPTTRTFTDLTFDAQNRQVPWCAYDTPQGQAYAASQSGITPENMCTWAPDGIHPDQHQLVVNPANPTQIFEGSDGGVIRTSGTFSDASNHCNPNERPGLGAASRINCTRLLSRVPTVLDHTDKFLGSTIQFYDVAINPADSCNVMGGTQDNGTWSNIDPWCGKGTWPQIIYGDGGNSGFDKTNPTWRFNEFTGGFSDVNFHNGFGGPMKWVYTTSPMVNSGETISFYWPATSDPNPLPGTHPIYQGAQHVWRTWAWGAGHTSIPQQTTPDIAFYEQNCPDLTTFSDNPDCGDYQALGGPGGPGTAGDLTSANYGADRTGGTISWIARTASDHGTLWAATSAGRIFVTHNADATDPQAVVWHRVDNATSPRRYPSSIYVDPSDSSHAWISYNGYNAATPTTPGHVFSVTESGTFTNLNIESGTNSFPTPTNDGDLPVSDIVRDDSTHTLYASTEFGVLKGRNDGTNGWVVMNGLPRYEVLHLAISPSNREPTCNSTHGHSCKHILYAATHSQGIWALNLGGGDDDHGHGHGH